MKIGKQILETGKEILIDLGVFSLLKEHTAQAMSIHFGGLGKNDERIFSAELLRLDPVDQKTILDFFVNLEDWQQIQFILFVAGMPGPTIAQQGKKGQLPALAKPGDRQPFLKGLATLNSHQDRIEYLETLHVFSPISISRLLADMTRGAKGLRSALANQGWQSSFQDGLQKVDEAQKKAVSWLQKLEQQTRRR